MKHFLFISLLSWGVLLSSAFPQYRYPNPNPNLQSSSDISSSSVPVPAGTSNSGVRVDRVTAGGVNVECARREVTPGKFQFSCEEIGQSNGEALTLKSEHVLWLQQDGGSQQQLDIVVPNYKIDELIKAGFKGGDAGGVRVNILLRRPETVYNAEVGPSSGSNNSPPSVSVQYEPVQKLLVHYPNDKPYRPLSSPISQP